jgi:Cu2+-exporting ATPase/Cu+-exporting ATPase
MTPPATFALPAQAEGVRACLHCGTAFEGAGSFCCHGCHTVYDLLSSSGLGTYYDLKAKGYCFQPGQPVDWKEESYGFLDAQELRPRYVDDAREARFFVEGVHCVACLWLLERLPKLGAELSAARLDLAQSLLTVTLKEGASLAAVAGLIQRLGYRPHAIPVEGDTEELRRRDDRKTMLRLGVAGACAGNIMLMAISLYGGAGGSLATLFRWVSFGLFLPVAAFSAVPFYQSALGALRTRRINIDVPIVLAILLGAIVSAVNLARGSEHIYFDSLAALVFLLLGSRYYLKQVQARAARTSQLVQHFFVPIAHRMEGAALQDLPPERLRAGDRVKVLEGERIPADGRVLEGASFLNASWLTGEHRPVAIRPGDAVHAGSRNEGGPLVLEVELPVPESRLGQILQQLAKETRSPIIGLTDRVSRHFLAAVLAVSAGLFLWFLPSQPWEGLNRALSLLIVTCPCALALATPVTFSYALGRAYRRGFIVKDGEALEQLSGIDTVYFDKTGTLTHGERSVEAFLDLEGDPGRNRRLALGLESASRHAIARALRHHLLGTEPLVVEELREVVGKGVEGRLEGRAVALRALPDPDAVLTTIGLYEEDRLLARIALRDQARSEAREAVARLRELGCTVGLLSGDGEQVVRNLADEVGISPEDAGYGLSPEAKHAILAAAPRALMVGDGANDALALQKARVGVAMHGGMDLSLKAADVYLSQPDLRAVPDLVVLGRETQKVLRRDFALSLAYNFVGGGAALLGWINPLVAAIVMPLSSITVLLSSALSTREIRSRFKEGLRARSRGGVSLWRARSPKGAS